MTIKITLEINGIRYGAVIPSTSDFFTDMRDHDDVADGLAEMVKETYLTAIGIRKTMNRLPVIGDAAS